MVFHNEMHIYMGLIERNESQPSAEGLATQQLSHS